MSRFGLYFEVCYKYSSIVAIRLPHWEMRIGLAKIRATEKNFYETEQSI